MTVRQLQQLYAVTFVVTAVAAIVVSIVASHLVYNATPSLPLGFYWMSRARAIRRSDVVAFKIPPNVERLVQERHYLPGNALLLKPVIAAAGDEVCTTDGILRVNGVIVGIVRTEDSGGHPLPHEPWCGPVPEDAVFVASPHPMSFDSRTFGLVPIRAVLGTVVPLWT